jgi:DNA-binding phage protein
MVRLMVRFATAIENVRAAIKAAGKHAVADRAGLGDTILRAALDPHWNPTARTLGKLESAALEILSEREDAKRREKAA